MNNRRLTSLLTPAIGTLALTLLAFGLRLHRLDFQPLWGDEGWSFYFASMGLGQMIQLTAEDIHPPLYYALLGGWLRLAGSTPEVARFLSILFGTALVPLSYRAASRHFDRSVGLAAAAVISIAPFAIYYSQEIRMYGLVTLLGLGSVFFFRQLMTAGEEQSTDRRELLAGSRYPIIKGRRPRTFLLGYILSTTAALYTMYYAVFIPLLELVYFIASNRRQGLRRLITHRFIRSLLTVVLLYLPWIIFLGTNLVDYVQGKRTAEGYVPLGFFGFIQSHLSAFSLGHFSEATRILSWGTLLFLPAVFLGLFYRVPNKKRHGPGKAQSISVTTGSSSSFLALYLFLPLVLGFFVNLVYPFTPRYFERTLMLAAPAWWLLLAAGLVWIYERNRLVLAGVSATLLLLQTVMLLDFYNLPRYQDEDYRPLLAYVRVHSSPDDVFLASYQWQVGFYYAYLSPPRPVLYQVPEWGETWATDPAAMRDDLDRLVRDHPRLWFPAYQALGRLWETQVETYLNQTAFPAHTDWRLANTKFLVYTQGGHLASASAPFNFANRLLLEQAEVGDRPAEAGRGIIPVTLVWRKLGNLGSEHRVALRLTDADGRTWASRDSLPQAGDASFASLTIGQQLADRHGLAVVAGTPPGDYQLRLSVYDLADDHPLDLLDAQDQPQGVEANLAEVRVALPHSPIPPEALPVQHPIRLDFDGRVRLLGYSLGNGPYLAGDMLRFSLFWQALTDDHEHYIVFAQLQDEMGQPAALSETPPIYPSERWSAGTLLRDPREILVPATLPAGTYRLVVGLLRSDGSRLPVGGNDQAVLSKVETTQRAHDFSRPSPSHLQDARFGNQARLIGYDLRPGMDIGPGRTMTLVFYWQALETFSRPYAVFVHLVDADGRIVGQRDQEPGDGEFPTTSWVPGEYLTDGYAIPISPDLPRGEYRVEVGFYNPRDGTRLPVASADGQLLGDRLLLSETPIQVK